MELNINQPKPDRLLSVDIRQIAESAVYPMKLGDDVGKEIDEAMSRLSIKHEDDRKKVRAEITIIAKNQRVVESSYRKK